MFSRSVPTQRAVWYIRIAVLNECVRHQRPDRPTLSPPSLWTQQLANLLRSDMRRTSQSSSKDRYGLWDYVLDLARWQVDEGLVDLSLWLRVIADVVRTELSHSQNISSPSTVIAILTARRFLPELLSDKGNALMFGEALLPAAKAVIKALRNSANQVRDFSKSPKAGQRKPTKRPYHPSNPFHVKLAQLLDAAARALDPEFSSTGNDLERLLVRGTELIIAAKEGLNKPKPVPKAIASSSSNQNEKSIRLSEPHQIMREFEMLPAHGDVAHVISVLRSSVKDNSGSVFSAVKTVCQWALDSPVSDRAEAIAVAGALLTHLSSSQDVSVSSSAPSPLSVMQAGSPSNMKRGKPVLNPVKTSLSGSAEPFANLGSSSNTEPQLHRELWQFFKEFSKDRKVDLLERDNYIVRFLSHLCRLNLLSLPNFVRDVSRLSSCEHPGSAYLVKCLSMLPDPSDRSVADVRRSLMRKFGHASSSRPIQESHGVDDSVFMAACSGDMTSMEIGAETLMNSGNTNVILSTSEAVLHEPITNLFNDTYRRIITMISFLVFVDEPAMTVEWLLNQLVEVIAGVGEWKSEAMGARRIQMMSILTRLVGDLSRYIAACGHLETVFSWMRKGYTSPWVTNINRNHILQTLASMASIFSARADSGSMYWPKMVLRVLGQNPEASKMPTMIEFAVASLRGRLVSPREVKNVGAISDISNPENMGLSPDVDLQIMMKMTQCHEMYVLKLRERFSSQEHEFFPIDALLDKGMTVNDLLGAVFIPILADLLCDPSMGTSLESPFSKMTKKVLLIFETKRNDIRLQGVRPTLIIDLMALITAGCACVHISRQESVDVLVRMTWIWKILVPRAGIQLAKRLRSRVHYYCERTATTGKVEWIGILSNMVLRVYGDPGRDESLVCSSLGNEPFGMIEMQLALLAVNRRECGEDDDFGTRVSDAACLDRDDGAQTLTNMALECCSFDEDYRQAMAKIIAYHAVQKMVESLNYVVTGLTMETSKSTAIHQERAGQWYDADRARRIVLECCIEYLAEDVGSGVEGVLFEQLMAAGKKLSSAMSSGCLPSDMLIGGQQISDALESRLQSILRSNRAAQSVDWWKQRSLEIAQLLKGGVALMKKSAVRSCLDVLELCIRNIGDIILKNGEDKSSGIGGNMGISIGSGSNLTSSSPSSSSTSSGSGVGSGNTAAVNSNALLICKQVLDHPINTDLKKQFKALLTPTLLWIDESAERDSVRILIGRRGGSINDGVYAIGPNGQKIDNWALLEGYGRGSDESSSIPPSAFWRQGDDGRALPLDEESGRTKKLKRTYSTYSSLVL